MILEKPLDYSKFQFRSHYLGDLMTEPKSGSGLSETCISKLHQIHTEQSTGRSLILDSKYIRKGLAVESESAKLLSIYDGRDYDLHPNRIYDKFTQGECDIEDDFEDIIIDLKNAFDVFTFRKNVREVNQNINYWWQGQNYCSLYKKSGYVIANTLCNTPSEIILQEKKNALYKIGLHKADSIEYEELCSLIDMNSIFDDMAIEERVIKTSFSFMPIAIKMLHERLADCRLELNKISEEDFDRIKNKTTLLFTKLPKSVISAGQAEMKAIASNTLAPVEDDDDEIAPVILKTDEKVLENINTGVWKQGNMIASVDTANAETIESVIEATKENGELKIRQIDIEESIAVVKSEQPEIVQAAFNALAECKVTEDYLELYRNSYDARQISPEFVEALTLARNASMVVAETPAKVTPPVIPVVEDDEDDVVAPVSVVSPKEIIAEIASHQEAMQSEPGVISSEKQTIIQEINSATSSVYLRNTVYKEKYKSQIDADKKLMDLLQKVGTELIKKEMNS